MPTPFRRYPGFVYKLGEKPRIVNSDAELAALGAGWQVEPIAPPAFVFTRSNVPIARVPEQQIELVLKPVDQLSEVLLMDEIVLGSLDIYWNGLSMTVGEDYTVAGRVVSLASPANPGDVMKFRYRRA